MIFKYSIMRNYLENTDEKLVLQMDNFSSKIETYAPQFGITPAEVTSIKNDTNYLVWTVSSFERVDTYKKNWTSFKTNLKKGTNPVLANVVPSAIEFDVAPVAVPPGILNRFTALVARIKTQPTYNKSIGLNLGIEITTHKIVDMQSAKPTIKASIQGGKVHLQWKKGNYQGLVIEKDTGSGFAFFDKDFRPNYVDNSPLPLPGESAIWKYRAAYLYNDTMVGQWSDVVIISVNG